MLGKGEGNMSAVILYTVLTWSFGFNEPSNAGVFADKASAEKYAATERANYGNLYKKYGRPDLPKVVKWEQ
jgi:hypothetical protein